MAGCDIDVFDNSLQIAYHRCGHVHRCGQFPNPDNQNPNKILPTCLVCVGSADVQSTAIAEWWWNPYLAFDAMSSLLSKTRFSEMIAMNSILGKNPTGAAHVRRIANAVQVTILL